jgi:NADPH-dependent glutamate synthase beta subunit-like oxidoreductase
MDASRTALRLGASSITVVYRRTREEMPVQPEEISEALEEGVKFEFLVAPVEVIRNDDKSAVAIKLQKMRLGDFDDSGRRRPVPIEGEFIEIPATHIIRAIGQKTIIPTGGPSASKWGTLMVDQFTLATDFDGVFAGGDRTWAQGSGGYRALPAPRQARKISMDHPALAGYSVRPHRRRVGSNAPRNAQAVAAAAANLF